MLKLEQGEEIVCVYARRAGGPGWANRPIWVIVRGLDCKLREECLQPEDYGPDAHKAYCVAEEAHNLLRDAIFANVRYRRTPAEPPKVAPEFTDWFPGHVKPQRIGYYERYIRPEFEADPKPVGYNVLCCEIAYWDGTHWCRSDGHEFFTLTLQNEPWRGLTKEMT